MAIIVEGNKSEEEFTDEDVLNKVNYFINKGMSKKDAIECTSDILKVKKNYVKDLII